MIWFGGYVMLFDIVYNLLIWWKKINKIMIEGIVWVYIVEILEIFCIIVKFLFCFIVSFLIYMIFNIFIVSKDG